MLVVCNKSECVPTSEGQVAKHVFYNSQRQGSCCLCLAQSTKQAFSILAASASSCKELSSQPIVAESKVTFACFLSEWLIFVLYIICFNCLSYTNYLEKVLLVMVTKEVRTTIVCLLITLT